MRSSKTPNTNHYTLNGLSLAVAFEWATGMLSTASADGAPRLALSDPLEHSTTPGRQAVQYVQLIWPDGRTLIVGRLHHIDNRVELRGFPVAAWNFELCHRAPFPMEAATYQEHLGLLEDFCLKRGFGEVVTMLEPPAAQVITLDVPAVPKPAHR